MDTDLDRVAVDTAIPEEREIVSDFEWLTHLVRANTEISCRLETEGTHLQGDNGADPVEFWPKVCVKKDKPSWNKVVVMLLDWIRLKLEIPHRRFLIVELREQIDRYLMNFDNIISLKLQMLHVLHEMTAAYKSKRPVYAKMATQGESQQHKQMRDPHVTNSHKVDIGWSRDCKWHP